MRVQLCMCKFSAVTVQKMIVFCLCKESFYTQLFISTPGASNDEEGTQQVVEMDDATPTLPPLPPEQLDTVVQVSHHRML